MLNTTYKSVDVELLRFTNNFDFDLTESGAHIRIINTPLQVDISILLIVNRIEGI